MSRKIGKLLSGAAAYVAAYTPAGFWPSSSIPNKAILDRAGSYIVDRTGAYVVTRF